MDHNEVSYRRSWKDWEKTTDFRTMLNKKGNSLALRLIIMQTTIKCSFVQENFKGRNVVMRSSERNWFTEWGEPTQFLFTDDNQRYNIKKYKHSLRIDGTAKRSMIRRQTIEVRLSVKQNVLQELVQRHSWYFGFYTPQQLIRHDRQRKVD
jgi:hypothetical protein